MASAGDLLNGRYRLIEVLGDRGVGSAGGLGTVFRAYDETAKRPAAVKVMRPEFAADPRFREAFLRESGLAMKIEHPNIIPVYDVGDGEDLYVATRLVAGADLGQRLLMTGRIPLEQTLGIAQQISAALEAIHGAGLTHGDVKPGNVLLAPSGSRDQVYLTDFGIARAAAADLKISSVSRSLAYRSPELFKDNHAGPSADVYALSCLTVQCLTGRTPFLGPDYRDYQRQHETDPPPKLADLTSGLPLELDAVIAAGMDKNPPTRPSAAAWMTALRKAAAQGSRSPAVPRKAAPAAAATAAAAVTTIVTPVAPSKPAAPVAPPTPPPAPVTTTVAATVAASAAASAPPPAKPWEPPTEHPGDEPPGRQPRSRRAIVGWTAAVIVLVAAVAIAGFAISKSNNGTHNSSPPAGAHSTAPPASTKATLTGSHTSEQAALFQRVSTLPLGQCKARTEAQTPTGQTAALQCDPGVAAADSIVVRQFDTKDHEVADAAGRPTAQNATTQLRPCDPNGTPPNPEQVAAWGFWTDGSRQQGYIQCFPQNKAGGRALVLTYDDAAIELELIKNSDSSAQAGIDLYDWWDQNIRTTALAKA